MPVSAEDLFFLPKPADVRLIIEIRHTADALAARSPVGDHIEITLDMLENLETHDHVIRLVIALGTTSVSYEEAVITSGSLPGSLNSNAGEIKPAISYG